VSAGNVIGRVYSHRYVRAQPAVCMCQKNLYTRPAMCIASAFNIYPYRSTLQTFRLFADTFYLWYAVMFLQMPHFTML